MACRLGNQTHPDALGSHRCRCAQRRCVRIFSSFALEALIFFGVFAIDLKTGAHDGGFRIAGSVRVKKKPIAIQPALPQAKAA